MPAQSSSVIPTLPGTLFVLILSPGFSNVSAMKLLMKPSKLIQDIFIFTCHCCCPADINSWSKLLNKDELLSVRVEDDNGDTAVTSHQVPDLSATSLTVFHPHGIEETRLVKGN